jgi:hypothetical protein
MRSPWVHDVLSPSDIISGVVESCEIVVINSMTLKEDGIALVVTMRKSSSFGLEAIEDMLLQPRKEILCDI